MEIKIQEKIKKIPANNPKKIAKILQDILKAEKKTDRMKEHFWGIYFNSRLNIITIELISLGILDATIVHPREVFYPAIINNSASLLIAHNHPSGDTEPSKDDIATTQKIKEAGEILGIKLIDNIIITKNDFYSFESNNLL